MTRRLRRVSPRVSTLSTVSYADIFDYPLTGHELHTWAMGDDTLTRVKGIEQKRGFYFLKGRAHLVDTRFSRQIVQKEKWRIAGRAARWLACIPTIQLVGVTGGLSMDNAGESDDIDLFLITAPHTLWISRMLAVVCMDLLGLRRKPLEKDVVNKICLNMFLSKRTLGMPISERDCFSAHEILQMKPLWEQPRTYKDFLRANSWVQAYLPNAWKKAQSTRVTPVSCTPGLVLAVFQIFEIPARELQLWYMSRHRTSEVITDTMLRFHPKDARRWVKQKLSLRLRKFNIPLDKIFYAR